jgi:hypothetical protein
MKFALIAVLGGLLAAPYATAQKLELKFDALAAKASKKVELNLDGNLLRLAARFSGEADVKGLLAGVQAIHVRNYEFAKDGAYSQKDLEPLRNQVAGQSRWSRILDSKEDEATTEIYIAAQGDKVSGCLIVTAESRELHIIYLEGTMPLAQMRRLVDEDARAGLGGLFENR